MQHPSMVSRLKTRLSTVVNELSHLVREIAVCRMQPVGGGIIFIRPDYYWGDLTTKQRAAQMLLKRDYEPIAELLRLLLSQAPVDLVEQLDEADRLLRRWLELQDNWRLSPDPSENEAALRSDATAFEHILTVLEVTGGSALVIVPDTNSLLAKPDPTEYRAEVGGGAFVFMLLPTVLGELDQLKVEHRNPDVREKARKMITRIKGWRQQGPLSYGVTVNKVITVKACHREPDMKRTLSWLDGNIQDDRIIASVLALQAEQPSCRIVLVTDDISLQNKADAALIETTAVP